MSISKRGLMRGAIGSGVALAASGSGANAQAINQKLGGPTVLDEAYRHARNIGASPEGLGGAIMDAARRAAIDVARKKMDHEQRLLERRERNLHRLKSVSPAFIEAQCEIIQRERHGLWEAFNKLCGE